MTDNTKISFNEVDLTRYIRQVELNMHAEPIEITRSGLLPPYEADTVRKFIPGIPIYDMRINYHDGSTIDIRLTPKQAEHLNSIRNDTTAVHAYAEELLRTIRPT
jgi:hypothetical protein